MHYARSHLKMIAKAPRAVAEALAAVAHGMNRAELPGGDRGFLQPGVRVRDHELDAA